MKNVEDIYPLSPLQQGLLFHSLLAPESGVYVNQCSCTLRGALDPEIFRQTWQEVADRHPILRTAFIWEGLDKPLQAVRRQVTLPWEEHDWRGRPEAEQQARLQALEQAERRPFSLGKAPLMRFALVRLDDDAHQLVWTFHHLLLDGWSTPLLLQEIAAIYQARQAGSSVRRPPSRPFRDYIAWLKQQDLERAETFWRGTLAGFTSPTPLVLERTHGDEAGTGEETLSLSSERTAALQALATRARATLNIVVQAAWALLLSRSAGEEDVLFGTVVSGRPGDLPGVESILGLFINTLPLRIRVAADERVLPWLQALHAQQAEIQQYEHSPLAQVQKWSGLPPGTPLFESLFAFENYPSAEGEEGAGTPAALRIAGLRNRESTNYPLTLAVASRSETLLRVTWDRSRFSAGAVRRLLGHLATLLAEMAAGPERCLADLPHLTAPERDQLLNEWNRPGVEAPCATPLHRLFAAAAANTPEATAVSCEGREISYGELDRSANRLAHALRRLGIGLESRVGLCVERSPELVAGLLGILKAGGAYVPLDPDMPGDRLAWLLADSGVRALLTGPGLASRLRERLPEGLPEIAFVDVTGAALGQESPEPPEELAAPDNAAYVIYTSGSTGRPKGVVVTHANVARLLAATEPWFDFSPGDVWTLFHSFAFDFSVWEIWGALAYGGRVVVVPFSVSRSPEAFLDLLEREGVTVLNQTPSAFRQLVHVETAEQAAGRPPRRLALREVIFGGEALDLPALAPWLSRHGDERPRLVNMYGITETTVHVTFRPVRAADAAAGTGSLIGVPIPDLQVHLLDRHGQLAPVGVPGEIHVGGGGVARGYLGRPELTAERFVPDPFSRYPGARLYRSGDLARRLPGGDLEYLGRIDQQIKIRGFRIEPGEIEAALADHPSVRDAVVLTREREDGHRQLIAWVVAGPEGHPSAEDLRAFLAARLPDYMVPAHFVPLAELPLTVNGKLDRRALPEPEAGSVARQRFLPPEGREEQILAEAWAAVLQVERVGRDDNFFALGGDSILSLRVLARVREQGLELSLQQLFQTPTLRELARAFRGGAGAAREQVPPFGLVSEQDRAKMPADVEDAYPLARLQAGMVFHSERSPETAIYHDIFSYHLRAPFDADALRAAIDLVAERHPVLRTSFALTGFRESLQLVHREARPALSVESLRHLDPEARAEALRAWMETEKRSRFEWSRPPLLRFQVHRLTEDELQLTVSFHHAILDGWSVATLLTELFQQYLALLGREAAVPPAPVLPYREFVAEERRALESEETLAWWLRKLDAGPLPRLARWPFTPEAGARQVRLPNTPIDRETTEGLKRLADAAGVPLKSVLVAAHLRALSLWSGADSAITGLVSNGRSESGDGERVLGLFLNSVPFRVDLAEGTWTDLARQAFREETEMLPHRRYPMADLQRRLGGQPLFETAFTYVSFHVYEQLAGFREVQVLGNETHEQTNFPLSVFFSSSASTGRLDMSFDYDAGQLDTAQVLRIAATHAAVLEAMAARPEARWQADRLLPRAEIEQILSAADGGAPAAGPEPVHRWFERLAAEAPNAPAVVADAGSLSRGALDRRANQVARALRLYGVQPGASVALAVGRTQEMPVALLAIWKAGGSWVPLDPAWPPERLISLLDDSEASLVVTTEAIRNDLPAQIERMPVLTLDTEGWLIDSQDDAPLAGYPDPEDPAYLIYTSGSTGRPKAVVVPHRGLGNLAAAQIATFGIAPGDRLLQFASLSFDAAVSEVLTALLGGAELHLADASRLLPGPGFVALLRERRITHLTLPPSVLAAVPAADLPDLATLVVAGEACPPELARRWAAGRRLVNAYGPTETTVCATMAPVAAEDLGPRLPLGSPIPGFRALVLDRHLEPPPAGVPGELFLGGVGLARGYRGRPDLTAASWVPDPFAAAPGGRLYRTGDLARHLPNGTLELLGRIDHQVKVRGYRIETGEIEARLAQHPAVRAAAVLAREDVPGDRRLVAYIVLAGEAAEGGAAPQAPGELSPAVASALRAHLSQAVPDYMLPAFFAVLPALPLTPSGKVDRRALPAPGRLQPAADRPYAAPRNPTEQTIARIWAEVLSLERVGIDDNLFEIGGHSLLATQIAVQLQESFGVEVPVRLLFDVPTVAGLATAILQQQAEQADEEAVARMLAELEQLSDEDLQARLAEETGA